MRWRWQSDLAEAHASRGHVLKAMDRAAEAEASFSARRSSSEVRKSGRQSLAQRRKQHPPPPASQRSDSAARQDHLVAPQNCMFQSSSTCAAVHA